MTAPGCSKVNDCTEGSKVLRTFYSQQYSWECCNSRFTSPSLCRSLLTSFILGWCCWELALPCWQWGGQHRVQLWQVTLCRLQSPFLLSSLLSSSLSSFPTLRVRHAIARPMFTGLQTPVRDVPAARTFYDGTAPRRARCDFARYKLALANVSLSLLFSRASRGSECI